MESVNNTVFKLIVTVVNEGLAADVIEAGRRAGAGGSTVLNGGNSNVHEPESFLNLVAEPEKEIVLILVDSTITNEVLESISKEIGIDKNEHGSIFVVDVDQVIGIRQLIPDEASDNRG